MTQNDLARELLQLASFLLMIVGNRRQVVGKLRDGVTAAIQVAKQHGWAILVGDGGGVEVFAVRECQRLGVPCIVYGRGDRARNGHRAYIRLWDAGQTDVDRDAAAMRETLLRPNRVLGLWDGDEPEVMDVCRIAKYEENLLTHLVRYE
jgi:hypothetical protein